MPKINANGVNLHHAVRTIRTPALPNSRPVLLPSGEPILRFAHERVAEPTEEMVETSR